MNTQMDFGRESTERGYYDGNVTSERITRTKSMKVTDIFDAQEKMLEYSKHLITNGLSEDVTFRLLADKVSRKPKRIEVTWVSDKAFIPVNRTIAKA